PPLAALLPPATPRASLQPGASSRKEPHFQKENKFKLTVHLPVHSGFEYQTTQERILGYGTLHESGACTHTDVSLQWINTTFRQVYGQDGRFVISVISDSQFITTYPFSTAVRISAGCSGVLVSPKHVLTAAHWGKEEGGDEESIGKIQRGWIHTNNSTVSVFSDYNYALLELKRAVKQKHMELEVAPCFCTNVVYRFCSVTKESDDLIYQHCDDFTGHQTKDPAVEQTVNPQWESQQTEQV
uniref:Inactive serine protease 35 n=1 Tax=Oryzias latipes TaxID=8090 RepID=A0A3B3HMN8_ORYLA